jgi:hypothetical protein
VEQRGDTVAAVKKSQLLELPPDGNFRHQGTGHARVLSVHPPGGFSGRSRCDMRGKDGGVGLGKGERTRGQMTTQVNETNPVQSTFQRTVTLLLMFICCLPKADYMESICPFAHDTFVSIYYKYQSFYCNFKSFCLE